MRERRGEIIIVENNCAEIKRIQLKVTVLLIAKVAGEISLCVHNLYRVICDYYLVIIIYSLRQFQHR